MVDGDGVDIAGDCKDIADDCNDVDGDGEDVDDDTGDIIANDDVDEEDDDDDAVNKIVNASYTSNISSISGNSNESTVSVSSMDTLPKEHNEGLYDATLLSGMPFLHCYGKTISFKKMFFNVYKFNKNRHTKKVVNIKVHNYILYKNAMKCKTRFIFAGILCKYTDYLKHHNNPTHKLTSKYLV